LLTEYSNTVPNNSHMAVFIYYMLPCQTWKSRNVRKISVATQYHFQCFRQVYTEYSRH